MEQNPFAPFKTEKELKFYYRYVSLAHLVATWSEDDSTQVGAVIVGPDRFEIRSFGFNGLPRGIIPKPFMFERPTKYKYFEHAERNAVYNVGSFGAPFTECTMYLNWEPGICTDCARAVIQSDIERVVGPPRPFAWKVRNDKDMMDDLRHALYELKEAEKEVIVGPYFDIQKVCSQMLLSWQKGTCIPS